MHRVARVGRVATLMALCTTLAIGCTTGSSGSGGGGIPCALDGSCPGTLVCAGAWCMSPQASDAAGDDGIARAQDSASSADTTSADDISVETDASAGDTAVANDTAVTNDTAAANDTAVADDTIGANDTAVANDSVGTDTSGGVETPIAGLQKGTASLVCVKTDGEATTFSGVTLAVGVATAAIAPAGTLRMFYVRPEGAPSDDPNYQGIKIVVFGKDPLDVQQGDRVRVQGDVAEYFCETEIKTEAAKVEVLGKASTTPQPYLVDASAVAALSQATEPFEGVYVEIQNVSMAAANVIGSDSKTHGSFAVAPFGSKKPEVHITPQTGSKFMTKNSATGEIGTIFDGSESFKSIRGHITYSFGTFQLRPTTDADIVVNP